MEQLFKEIKLFRELQHDNVQFDILRPTGEVLLQVYKNRDVLKWRNIGIEFGLENGYVVEIRFPNSKKGRINENYNRFYFSDYYASFREFQNVDPKGAYFCFLNESIPNEDFMYFLSGLIQKVYDLGDSKVICHVRKLR